MSTRILLGVKTAGDNLPPSSADVMESGSLNFPEPSGPHRPVMGLLYLYFFNSFLLNIYTIAPVHLLFEHISSLNSITQCTHT
jgi:hypothetical protein